MSAGLRAILARAGAGGAILAAHRMVSERDIAFVKALRDVDVATLVIKDAMSPQVADG